jgi:hypothetical protein
MQEKPDEMDQTGGYYQTGSNQNGPQAQSNPDQTGRPQESPPQPGKTLFF